MDFKKRYQKLNDMQRIAVDSTEGPVVVIAGPGSGKTELLAIRTANILQKTDTPPQSVLCLTFTNSATLNMKERLLTLIGEDAYKVPIYTFHSFCLQIIENHPDFFFKGVDFNLADQPVKMQMIKNILEELEYDDPLKRYHPEKGYIYLKDIERAIFYLQDGGINPIEFEDILKRNKKEIKEINKLVGETLEKRVSRETIVTLQEFFKGQEIKKGGGRFKSLSEVVLNSLKEVVFSGETSALSEWKRRMTTRTGESVVFKETTQIEKMESLARVYKKYRQEMYKRGFYTFSDMVLNVTEVLEKEESLRREVQEKYLYFQVDEFQDTSGVQMRLLNLLTVDDVDEKPNICVVGDDDQAIYRFQGADISNIIGFKEQYPHAKTVVLLKNYRSIKEIIKVSRKIILKAEERLEGRFPEIKKELLSENKTEGEVVGNSFRSKEEELSYVAKEVQRKIKGGRTTPGSVAVIARTHRELKEALCYFNALEIPVFAERKENVFEKQYIKEITTILRFTAYLLEKEDLSAKDLLPEILTFPFLKVPREKLWEVAQESYRRKISWMDYIINDKQLRRVGLFLLEVAAVAKTHPVEEVIDIIIGNKEVSLSGEKKKFLSGFKNFYFTSKVEGGEYLSFLSSLKCFVGAVRRHQRQKTISVKETVQLIDFYEENAIPILDKNPLLSEQSVVSLITAHGAKGREFETVFVLNCHQSAWGKEKRGKMISLPLNLPLEKAGNKRDDQIRLFYVAITRAKKNLYLTTHNEEEGGREVLKLEFISDFEMEERREKISEKAFSLSFASPDLLPFRKNEKEMLLPLVERYQLSATGFNKFLNVDSGGPEKFFGDSLLRFPQKKSKMLSYGTAVHATIAETYFVLSREQRLLTKDEFIALFEKALEKERLSGKDFLEMMKRGKRELSLFYQKKASSFSPDHTVEKNLANEGCVIKGVSITGRIDKMVVSENSIQVYDYKTGAPLTGWGGGSESEKIKAWQYKNQLIFYKLLIESSRDFSRYSVSEGFLEFVTPDKEKRIITLSLLITEEETERLKALISVVGKMISSLNFPSVKSYKKRSLKGIRAFEEDLLS